jgi:hypothetical protein
MHREDARKEVANMKTTEDDVLTEEELARFNAARAEREQKLGREMNFFELLRLVLAVRKATPCDALRS